MWMKPKWGWALAVVVAVAGSAVSLQANDPVYVKAVNTRLLPSPDPTSNALQVLQPGALLHWVRKVPPGEFHEVTSGPLTGFVYFSSLSLRKPTETVSGGDGLRQIDAHAFSSSGAATKALSEGGAAYGDQKLGDAQAVLQVLALEALAKQVTAYQVSEHVKLRGLRPVVSGSADGGAP